MEGGDEGAIQVAGTDHYARNDGIDGDSWKRPSGSPQIETLPPLVYDGGVNAGRRSRAHGTVLRGRRARFFGFYAQNVAVAVRCDGYLVVFDPKREFTIDGENQRRNTLYTFYKGRTVLGQLEMSFHYPRCVLYWEKCCRSPVASGSHAVGRLSRG